VDVGKGLEHPSGGGAFGGFAFLVGESLVLLRQALPDAVFERGVDHEAQGHAGRCRRPSVAARRPQVAHCVAG